jgi:3-oxosteroid 1-dehydrogenase
VVAWDEMRDLVIVGSGAAGLTAAITAARHGYKPLVLEKAPVWGGTTALSGGGLWVPDNRFQRAAGFADSIEDAHAYLDEIIPEETEAASHARRDAVLRQGPRLIDMLTGEGVRWASSPQPDYESTKPHARAGRGLEMEIADGRPLGGWLGTMRRGGAPIAVMIRDIRLLARGMTTIATRFTMARVFLQHRLRVALGKAPLGCGESLAAQLMVIAQRLGVEVRLETALREVVVENGRATGVLVKTGGGLRRIGATAGLFLCAGGFARAGALRTRLQGVDGTLSCASPDDTGDVIGIAGAIGARTAILDAAWWGTAFRVPGIADAMFCVGERSLPYSLMVDAQGRRFVDESSSYDLVGKAMRARGIDSAWLIIDSRHRERYMFAGMLPGRTAQAMIDSGFLLRADTIAGLAAKCGLDAGELAATIARFNGFAASGTDDDFGRGGNAFDRFWSDPAVRPNGALGPIERAPFFAARIWLSDLGTKGGLLTDEHARVLHESGAPIERLYASGNCTASVFGHAYPGPGATLGPAMTFGYIGANHLAGRESNITLA